MFYQKTIEFSHFFGAFLTARSRALGPEDGIPRRRLVPGCGVLRWIGDRSLHEPWVFDGPNRNRWFTVLKNGDFPVSEIDHHYISHGKWPKSK